MKKPFSSPPSAPISLYKLTELMPLIREFGVSVEVGVGKRPSKHKETLQEKEKAGKEEPKVKGAARNIQVKNIKCENVVASVTFRDTSFDLKDLAEAFDHLGANYDPDVFPGVSLSPKGTKATFLIFKPGKANCVGTSSVEEARGSPKLLARVLAEKGFEVDPDPQVEVRNIVSRAVFNVTLDLESLHGSSYNTSYNPSSFPGLQLVLDDPDVDFLLFTSGQAVLHSKSREDIEAALERACGILREFATGSSLDSKTKEAIVWLEKKPRFTNLLKIVRDEPKGYTQIAEELEVKEMTAKQYVYECSGKETVKHEKKDGKIEVEITSEKMGIPKDYEKYPQLKRLLEDSLSENSNAEALYQWSELLSFVIGEQMNRKLEEKEEELKAEQQEDSRVSLDQAMSKAVKSGLLALSDETAIEILERVGEDPSSLSELKGVMELNEGARWRFEWLRSLGLVKPVLGKGENAIHELTKRGEKMLSRGKNSPSSQKSLGKQRHRLAKMAAGKDTTADELLNVLDGSWLENHRSKLEKIRKKYKNPLVKISKSFWLEKEGGDSHLKHAGVDIADHEASGALLCLELLDIHAQALSF